MCECVMCGVWVIQCIKPYCMIVRCGLCVDSTTPCVDKAVAGSPYRGNMKSQFIAVKYVTNADA